MKKTVCSISVLACLSWFSTTFVMAQEAQVDIDFAHQLADIQLRGNYDVGIGIASVIAGDINGDGIEDLIVAGQLLQAVSVIFGKKTFPAVVQFSEHVKPDIHFTSTPWTEPTYPPLHVADLNGDGIEDLFIPHGAGLHVYWGRVRWPSHIHVPTFPPDLRIVTTEHVDLETERPYSLVTTGDVNHDGMVDILFAHTVGLPAPTKKSWDVYQQKIGRLFWGRKQWPAIIDLRKQEADVVIWAPQPSPAGGQIRQIALADLNGDGYDDIVVSGWHHLTGAFSDRTEGPWHTGWIIPGGTHVSPKVVLQDTVSELPPRSPIAPGSSLPLRMDPWELGKVFGAGLANGDVNGDEIKDLVFPLFEKRKKNSKEMPQRLCLLAGQKNFFTRSGMNALSRCQLIFGSPGFDQGSPFPSRPPVLGDYNGDGRDDIFLRVGYPENEIKGLFGQSFIGQSINIKFQSTISVQEPDSNNRAGPFASFMNMGDINGDGRDDLLIVEPLGGGETSKDMGAGMLHVILGRDNSTRTGFKNKVNPESLTHHHRMGK